MGRIEYGKTSALLGPCAALILNALKALANIDHKVHLISPLAIEPIQDLKTTYLGSKNPRLHVDEILIALSISAATDQNAKLALEQLPLLQGAQVHCSSRLAAIDIGTLKKLGLQVTMEPTFS